jgi:putative transposase
MPNYHRVFVKGGTYFFTVVCNQRRPILGSPEAVQLLHQCFNATIKMFPFTIDALVILPDHLHTIWTLPENNADYSTRWKMIKAKFSHHFNDVNPLPKSASMVRKKEKGIWQRRFWEHTIRDEMDLERHCDYIHFNPVKHGYVSEPRLWENSSFRDFVAKGLYPDNWGESVGISLAETDLE